MKKRTLYLGGFMASLLLGIAMTSVAEIGKIEDEPAKTLLLPEFDVDLSKTPNQSEDQRSTKHRGKHDRKQQHDKAKTTSSSTNNFVGNGSHGSGGKISQTEDQSSAKAKSNSTTLFDITNTSQGSGGKINQTADQSSTTVTNGSHGSGGKIKQIEDESSTKEHKKKHHQQQAMRKTAHSGAAQADESSAANTEQPRRQYKENHKDRHQHVDQEQGND